MYLKIAVMNNSGNVGKSMICENLLKQRIPGSKLIKIETINSDGTTDETISAKNIKQVFEQIDNSDVAIIDIGSSNIETFTSNLKKLNGAHEDINFFFIPTIPKPKQQTDTINTIEELLDMGVDTKQVKIIFNFYDNDISPEDLYPKIFNHTLAEELKLKNHNNLFTIRDNPVFDMIGELGYTFTDIANDKRDFRALIRSTDNKEERSQYSHLRSAQRLAKGFIKELDLTFNKIMLACDIEIGS
ncbi:StbB family protein [Candidatus Enterovibrio escicola]|uniref:StbB family protein n=2 Tax=Candidatus Enterovibrio escicola TaxID=1927127 RepID=UPI001237AE78|nr:StbB family protein [Candidatus Enterovibrio escacola]